MKGSMKGDEGCVWRHGWCYSTHFCSILTIFGRNLLEDIRLGSTGNMFH